MNIGEEIVFDRFTWLVLDKFSETEYFLLSKNVLAIMPFADSNMATWETCSLRKYLNDTLYNSFSPESRSRIVKRSLRTNRNPWYGGIATETDDFVFLLSLEEVVHYFGIDDYSMKQSGKHYISDSHDAKRTAVDDDGHTRNWWLRTLGDTKRNYEFYCSVITMMGYINLYGDKVAYGEGVRPAMVVNI